MLNAHVVLFSRLKNLLKCEGSYALGGDTDRDNLYIAPTIITDVRTTDAIMCEEVCDVYYIILLCVCVVYAVPTYVLYIINPCMYVVICTYAYVHTRCMIHSNGSFKSMYVF